jgi:hypothetical protein
MALVDSGADDALVPAEMLVAVGVEYSALEPYLTADGRPQMGQGAGGKFEIRRLEAKLAFREWQFGSEVRVAQAGAIPGPVLGRNDFFDRFNVRFLWSRVPPVFDVDPIA